MILRGHWWRDVFLQGHMKSRTVTSAPVNNSCTQEAMLQAVADTPFLTAIHLSVYEQTATSSSSETCPG